MTIEIDEIAPVIHQEPVPETTETPAPEDKDITLKQSALDNLIKSRQAAALKKAAALETENQRLREVAAGGAADATELERIRGELSASKIERDAIAAAAALAKKETFIAGQIQKQNFVCDASTLFQLTQGDLSFDEKTKTFVTADGTSAEDYFKKFAESRKYLVRSDVIFGTGSSSSVGTIPPRDPGWQHYIGANSSARDANILAQRDPRKYAEYKRQARAAGAIS